LEKFAVVSTPRSGSVFFGRILGSHPRIQCYPEIFHPDNYTADWSFYFFWLQKVREDGYNLTHFRTGSILAEYLESIFSDHNDVMATGVDIKYNYFGLFPGQTKIIKQAIPKALHLIRRNILKTMISFELCERRKELGRRSHGTEKVPPVKLTIRPDRQLLEKLELRKDEIDRFRKALKNEFETLEIFYEDFFPPSASESSTTAPAVLKQIYEFLAIEEENLPVSTNLKKTNSDHLSDLIENYEEIRSFLVANGWEHLFDESGSPSAGPDGIDKTELVRKGEQYLGRGDLVNALQIFKELFMADPYDKQVVCYVGSILSGIGKSEDARNVYQLYLQKYPDDPEVAELYRNLLS